MNTFKTQLRKTTTLCVCAFFVVPCGYFFTCAYVLDMCLYTYMNRVFVFNGMTYDATFSKYSVAAITNWMRKKNQNLLAENCAFVFHRIDLIWSHTHEFISNEFAFAFYWIESEKCTHRAFWCTHAQHERDV